MTHAHPHGDGQPAPASRRVVLALAAVMSVLLLATVVALVVLWPKAGELPAKRSVFYEGAVPVSGTVERIVDPGDVATGQPGKIAVTLDDAGDEVLVDMGPSLVDDNIVGARVRLVRGPVDLTGEPVYSYMDFHRSWPLIGLGIAFVVVVVAVARLKGLAALGGLAGALALVWFFTLPALLAGRHGLAVALTTASAVLFIVVYLAHGVSVKSTTALLGTFAGVAAVTSLAAWAIPGAHLTPIVRDDLAQLPYIAPGIHVTGVLLCGMVLGGVGVLNDVTITQASSVWELRAAAPTDSRRRVFARAMRIGRDHIASTVYTIAFAYVGSAIGLLLVASTLDHRLGDLVTFDEIAEEVVATAVASIGLVLAIPLTTALGAWLTGKAGAQPRPAHDAEPRTGPDAESRPAPVAESRPIPVAEPRPIPVAEPRPIPVAEPRPASDAER